VRAEWRKANREKFREYQRKYRENNKEKCDEAIRRSKAKHPLTDVRGHLMRSYGLTLEQYEALVASQGGLCYICRGPPNGRVKKLSVDHNNTTGKLRKLLCDACNRALGFMKESPERLRAAAKYIEDHLVDSIPL